VNLSIRYWRVFAIKINVPLTELFNVIWQKLCAETSVRQTTLKSSANGSLAFGWKTRYHVISRVIFLCFLFQICEHNSFPPSTQLRFNKQTIHSSAILNRTKENKTWIIGKESSGMSTTQSGRELSPKLRTNNQKYFTSVAIKFLGISFT
jgi:hypothetical protein